MKKVMGLFVVGVLLQGVFACSSTSNEVKSEDMVANAKASEVQSELKKAGYRCESVVRTGTAISSKRCTTQAQRDKEKEDAQKLVSDGIYRQGVDTVERAAASAGTR